MTGKWHSFTNVGWTLGNDCPYKCVMCYNALQRCIGRYLEKPMADRIIQQLEDNGVQTVNFGGNEPIFTHGKDPRKSILPYIVRSLADRGIAVGMTSAGISVNYMYNQCFSSLAMLNDIDVSLDSPFEEEHNRNRGSQLFKQAVKALKRCRELNIPHTIVMCGMNWNLTPQHFDGLVRLAKETDSNIRVNFLRPTEDRHLELFPTVDQYYATVSYLSDSCQPIDIGEPTINALDSGGDGCPCGTRSLRINAITADGKIPVSPCVYAHDFKTGDLLTDDLFDIVNSPTFLAFQQRHDFPENIPGCKGCDFIKNCRGGCAARAYYHKGSLDKSLNRQDCYCPKHADQEIIQHIKESLPTTVPTAMSLVHQNYLCTFILKPN